MGEKKGKRNVVEEPAKESVDWRKRQEERLSEMILRESVDMGDGELYNELLQRLGSLSRAEMLAIALSREYSGRRGQRRKDWSEAFFRVFGLSGNVRLACFACNRSRAMVYRMRKEDKEFGERWELALENVRDRLHEEYVRRAVEGVERYVLASGKVVLDSEGNPMVERVYSDYLLDRLGKAHIPELFRESYNLNVSKEKVKVVNGVDITEI